MLTSCSLGCNCHSPQAEVLGEGQLSPVPTPSDGILLCSGILASCSFMYLQSPGLSQPFRALTHQLHLSSPLPGTEDSQRAWSCLFLGLLILTQTPGLVSCPFCYSDTWEACPTMLTTAEICSGFHLPLQGMQVRRMSLRLGGIYP